MYDDTPCLCGASRMRDAKIEINHFNIKIRFGAPINRRASQNDAEAMTSNKFSPFHFFQSGVALPTITS